MCIYIGYVINSGRPMVSSKREKIWKPLRGRGGGGDEGGWGPASMVAERDPKPKMPTIGNHLQTV